MAVKKAFKDMTPEEARAAGREGGIKSGEAKRKKKNMRETLEVILEMPMDKGKCFDAEDVRHFAALKGKNINMETALMVAMFNNALHGDVKAAEFIRDTVGQKPKDQMDINGSMIIPIIGGDEELED